jgi:hypothetical protein
MLLLLGLASPFMELAGGLGGLIGLFILFIGIRAAWQLTAGTEEAVEGPPAGSSPGSLSLR